MNLLLSSNCFKIWSYFMGNYYSSNLEIMLLLGMGSLLCFFFLPVSLQLPPSVLATGSVPQGMVRPCTFTDEATGFYASWHTNCSGLVNFVINVYNFPRSDMPHSAGNNINREGFFPGTFGRFWIGIGFRLVSTEIVVVENPFDGFVSVAQARLEPGRPPLRQIGQGILINPRGAFFGTTLEATFSIDESLLRGCKEFLFFTAPTPMGVPYGGQPYARQVCDLSRTCSRVPCAPGKASERRHRRFGGYGAPAGMGMGLMDYIGTGSAQDPTIPMSQQMLMGEMMMQQGPGNGPNSPSVAVAKFQLQPNATAELDDSSSRQKTDNPVGQNPVLDRPVTVAQRTKRQGQPPSASATSGLQNGFRSLKGTAYEGQDQPFRRMEPQVDIYNTQYEALTRWQAQQGNPPQMIAPAAQLPWRPIDQGGVNRTAMYWPERTAIGAADVQGMAMGPNPGDRQFGINPAMAPSMGPSPWAGQMFEPPADMNFYSPEKCDFGTDPAWCTDYVRQFTKWFEQYGAGRTSSGKTMCVSLRDSLKYSDHRCCNALQNLGC